MKIIGFAFSFIEVHAYVKLEITYMAQTYQPSKILQKIQGQNTEGQWSLLRTAK